MRIEYIREFLVVAKTLNMSTAATELFSTQSTLSRHIGALEEDLGVALLSREAGGRLTLTEEGMSARKSFLRIVDEYDSLKSRITNTSQQRRLSLTIGMFYNFVDELVSPTLRRFKGKYPDSAISFKSYRPRQLIDDLLNDIIDIGPVITRSFPGAERLAFATILEDSCVAMLTDDHPLADRDYIQMAELQDACFIFLSEDEPSNDLARKCMADCGIVPRHSVMTESNDSVVWTLRDTGGVHITGSFMSKNAFEGIRYVPISDAAMRYEIAFAYKRANENPAIPLFLEQL